ncbi:hypothetical protein ALO97_02389 [Pseudomonas syringae pv. tagetis]|uniref:Uncharacterized protein n=1 Tax=Pseudomonas syringae pv. tagetis TaxID=129140 RepID=A0A0Q0BET6_9PSED|nr:Uncharacterized protein ALO44_03068 [Pseudomonas syringae pv. tagetis]RMW14690.1 hypothetical protein ALO97_02389 [Pseudomonas syringae pv. tagetis]RMW16345.1 hypothetical protein ALO98_03369 [Pseudomonas syringae pv. tagetis]
MQVEAKIPLAVFRIKRNGQSLKKAFLDVLHQLGAAIVALAAKVTALPFVMDEVAIALVICKAVQPELELDGDLLLRNVKRQIKRLKVRHEECPISYFYVFPSHVNLRQSC